MNTQPLVRHMAMAPAITPALRWDGVTPIETHREAGTEALRDMLGMDTFMICEPVCWIYSGVMAFICGHLLYRDIESEEVKK